MLKEQNTILDKPPASCKSPDRHAGRKALKTIHRLRVASVLLFLLPLFILGLYSIFDTDPTVSAAENRTLKTAPEFSWSALASGQYTSELDEYYADTFPARERLILAGREIRSFLYIPLNSAQMIPGGDFEMGDGEALPPDASDFLPSGGDPDSPSAKPSVAPPTAPPSQTSEPTPDPTAEPSPEPTPEPTPEPDITMNEAGYLITGDRIMHLSYTSKEHCANYADMLGRLQNALPDRRVISLIAPNSFPFYAPDSQISSSLDQRAMIESLYEMYDSRIVGVNPFDRLMEHKDEYLYFRTDHHWNGRGAYWAYTSLCDSLGYTPTDIDTLEMITYEGFVGSFYRETASYPASKAAGDNPDTVEAFLPDTPYSAFAYSDTGMTDGWRIPIVNEALSEGNTNKYVCFTNGDQPLIHVRTETANGRSVVVVKESYGNALIPWLLAHYEDIYVIDYRKFNQKDTPALKLADFVTGKAIDDILVVNYCYVPNTSVQFERLAKMMP